MCCVGGMVEEIRAKMQITGSNTHLSWHIFLGGGAFSTGQPVPAAAASTNGGCGPVLELHFLAVPVSCSPLSKDKLELRCSVYSTSSSQIADRTDQKLLN